MYCLSNGFYFDIYNFPLSRLARIDLKNLHYEFNHLERYLVDEAQKIRSSIDQIKTSINYDYLKMQVPKVIEVKK